MGNAHAADNEAMISIPSHFTRASRPGLHTVVVRAYIVIGHEKACTQIHTHTVVLLLSYDIEVKASRQYCKQRDRLPSETQFHASMESAATARRYSELHIKYNPLNRNELSEKVRKSQIVSFGGKHPNQDIVIGNQLF